MELESVSQLELFSATDFSPVEQSIEARAIVFTALKIFQCGGMRSLVERELAAGNVSKAFGYFKECCSSFGFAIGEIAYINKIIHLRGHGQLEVSPQELFEVVKRHHLSGKEIGHD